MCAVHGAVRLWWGQRELQLHRELQLRCGFGCEQHVVIRVGTGVLVVIRIVAFLGYGQCAGGLIGIRRHMDAVRGRR